MITELATALYSPRGRPAVRTTYQRFMAHIKNGSLRVAGPKKEIDTYALLDDGSTVTLIDSDLAQQLGARGRNEPYT
ncbi:hypothetical protein EVAR_69165_1 [Eumeta japonica]|uniref:Uncharacterized protein n=1 Tax=Eumeta variegata TaxID=151549 RepID=A0A4C1ZIQ4_EUMVA|nr:hypothetical protein EVAR_69165_1 [Eumeta japonica]